MKYNCLPRTFERVPQHLPDYRVPKIFRDVVYLWVFTGLISSLGKKCILLGPPIHVPLLVHDYGAINIVDEGIFHRKSRKCKSLQKMSEGQGGIVTLGQTMHVCRSSHDNTACFWFFFLVREDNTAFPRSLATYWAPPPQSSVICSSKDTIHLAQQLGWEVLLGRVCGSLL